MEKFILIPQDKANHAIYGALIFLVAAFLLTLTSVGHQKALAMCVVVLAGALKEALDYAQNQRTLIPEHDVEIMDFAATALGGLAMYAGSCL